MSYIPKLTLYRHEVYPASYRLSDNWDEAIKRCKSLGYRYMDFNGLIYSVRDIEINRLRPSRENALCIREDLIEIK